MTGFYGPSQRNDQRMRRFMSISGIGLLAPLPVTLKTNLVSWYDFEDASGSTHVDSVGTNTLASGSATQAAGKVGNCAVLASLGSMNSSTPSGVSFLTGDFTIACWAKVSSATVGLVARWITATNARSWALLVEGGLAKFVVSTNGSAIAATAVGGTVNNSVYHLIIGWRSTTDGKIYVQVDNGTPVGVTFSAASTLFNPGAAALYVGELGGGVYNGGGSFDSTGIWSRELTSAERTTLWNGGAGLNYAAL